MRGGESVGGIGASPRYCEFVSASQKIQNNYSNKLLEFPLTKQIDLPATLSWYCNNLSMAISPWNNNNVWKANKMCGMPSPPIWKFG